MLIALRGPGLLAIGELLDRNLSIKFESSTDVPGILPKASRLWDAPSPLRWWGNSNLNPPAVHSGTAYMYAEDCTVYAVDVVSGERRWGTRIACYPSLPLLASDSLVYVVEPTRVYTLRTDTGKPGWSSDAPDWIASHLLFDGMLILADSSGLNPDSGRVWALNAATGDIIWSESVPGLSHRANLVISGTGLLAAAGPEIIALDTQSGRTLWKVRITRLGQILAMAANDDVVLASDTASQVVAVDTSLQRERWRFDLRIVFPGHNAQLFGGDYGIPAVMATTAHISLEADQSPYLYTLDLASGKVLWSQPGAQPTPCKNAICAQGMSPWMVVAYEERTGQEIWRAEIQGENKGSAEFVSVGDQVFITSRDDLFVLMH